MVPCGTVAVLVDKRVDTLIEPIGRLHIDHDDKDSTLRKGDIAWWPSLFVPVTKRSRVGYGVGNSPSTNDRFDEVVFFSPVREASVSPSSSSGARAHPLGLERPDDLR